MPIQAPKMGVLGDFGPLNVNYSSSRPPKGTSLHKSASFKLSTVMTCRRVDRKCDGHTQTGKCIFCPCIALDTDSGQTKIVQIHFT